MPNSVRQTRRRFPVWASRPRSTTTVQAYWRLGEQSGTSAGDEAVGGSTGTYNDGVLLSQPGAIGGDPNTTAEFDGVDDSVSVPGNSNINNFSQLTLEGWVYLDSYGEGNLGRFLVKPEGYQILFVSSGYIQFEAIRWGISGKWRTPTGLILPGRWYHLAFTYDYGSTANDPKIYIDGKAVEVIDVQAPSGNLKNDINSLIIGNDAVAGGRTFDGRIDEVAIYD